MSIDTDQRLSQAYDLIESDQLDEAQRILEPVLKDDPDNADAWWLYAHAVTHTNTARDALRNVQRIDPEYPEAAELLQTLEGQSGALPISRIGAQEPSLLPPVPATLPGMTLSETDEDDWDALDDEADATPIWRRPAFLLAVGLVLFLIIAALFILRPDNQSSLSPTSTTVAVVETPTSDSAVQSEPSPTSEGVLITETPIATEPPSTIEVEVSTDGEYAAIYQSFSAFTLPETAVTTEETSLGSTLLVSVCTQAGPEMRTTLAQSMEIIAQVVNSTPVENDAVGARMLDCNTNVSLLVVAATHGDAVDYAQGNLSEEEFQARWLPTG